MIPHISHPRIWEIFACGIQNPGLFNPKSKFNCQKSWIQYLECGIHGVKFTGPHWISLIVKWAPCIKIVIIIIIIIIIVIVIIIIIIIKFRIQDVVGFPYIGWL